MEKSFKIAVIALIFAIVAISLSSTISTNGSINTSELNLKVNKSGDTMGGNINMDNSSIMNADIIETFSLNVDNINSPLGVSYFTDIDMNGYNISNCGNCVSGENNTKVNKSGDTMTGELVINNINSSNNTLWFNNTNPSVAQGTIFSKTGRTDFIRNFISTTNVTTAINTFLLRANAQTADCIAGCGAFVIYSLQDNSSTAYNVGRSGVYWETKNSNIAFTEMSSRSGISDTAGTGGKFRVYGNGTAEIFNNTKMNKAGSGIEMVSPNGNIWCTTVSNLGALTTTSGTCA